MLADKKYKMCLHKKKKKIKNIVTKNKFISLVYIFVISQRENHSDLSEFQQFFINFKNCMANNTNLSYLEANQGKYVQE